MRHRAVVVAALGGAEAPRTAGFAVRGGASAATAAIGAVVRSPARREAARPGDG